MKYADFKAQQKNSTSNQKSQGPKAVLFILGVLIVMGTVGFFFKDKILSYFNPISIIANASTVNLKETDGRTNILLLGYDKRSKGSEGSELTDTILVASIGKIDKDVVLISIPRDLWVQTPNGDHSKINAIYTNYGVDALKNVVQQVLGMPIHYHALVTFDLFEKSIDVLGGVNVNVENGFTDYQYPVEGKENDPDMNARYQTVKFEPGIQKMDGETALKFARSRHGDNNEGTDFARAKRQQKIIMAIKEKALSLETIMNPARLKDLYDTYASNVDTNIDWTTIQSFYTLSQQIEFDKVTSVVLDDRSAPEEGGLLYAPTDTTLYKNQYVLLPKTGDYTQIHAYVQKFLFGEK